jgi:outer membrane protein assembly factor BamB
VDGEYVYSINREGDLICCQVSDGAMRWTVNVAKATGARVPGWGFSGSPLVLSDRLVLNVGESGAAFRKDTGVLIWKSGDSEAGYMTPIPVNVEGKLCVLIASGKFYQCVDSENGHVFWKHRWLTTYGCNAASPLIQNGFAFISSGYGRGCALLELGLENYRVVWSNKEMQNQLNSAVRIDGLVYGFDGDEGGDVTLKCIEWESGVLKWSFAGLGSGALTASNGKLIVLSQHGELLVAPAQASEFKPTSRIQVLNGKCWTVPVLSQAKIYCRNAAGELVCLDVHNQ